MNRPMNVKNSAIAVSIFHPLSNSVAVRSNGRTAKYYSSLCFSLLFWLHVPVDPSGDDQCRNTDHPKQHVAEDGLCDDGNHSFSLSLTIRCGYVVLQ